MGGMDPADLKALERTPLFQAMPRGHRKRVARLATVDHYHDGDPIVREGDPGGIFVVMLSGDALVESSDGGERLLVSDEFFGELSLIDGRPRAATVTAAGPVKVARIGREDFRALLTEEPALAAGLLPGVAAVARDLLRTRTRHRRASGPAEQPPPPPLSRWRRRETRSRGATRSAG